MIIHKTGDLLDVTEGVIVHGCNAQGVMGSGVAHLIRNKYPKAFEIYMDQNARHIAAGLNSTPLGINSYYAAGQLIIVNAITQEFYGRDPKVVYVNYEAVFDCFTALNSHLDIYQDANMKTASINFPLIGCGLANGDWNIVAEIIDQTISDEHEKILWTL